MANPRPVHPFDRWTEEEQTRVLAGNTVRRGRPESVDPFIVSGLALLFVIVIGVPLMAWIMGRYIFGLFWR